MSETNINIGAVRWGYREARAYQQRRRTQRMVKITVGTILVLLGLAVLIGLGARSAQPARADGIVSPAPWCQISAPTLPANTPAGATLSCIKPRMWVAMVGVQR